MRIPLILLSVALGLVVIVALMRREYTVAALACAVAAQGWVSDLALRNHETQQHPNPAPKKEDRHP